MKALSVRQPWASMICQPPGHEHPKTVENRTWAPSLALGDEFLIHASRSASVREVQDILADVYGKVAPDTNVASQTFAAMVNAGDIHGLGGRILGKVKLVAVSRDGVWNDCLPGEGDYCDAAVDSHWHIGPIGWIVRCVEVYQSSPVVNGKLGLWTVPDDVLAQLVPL